MFSSLGDIVLTTPILTTIKTQFPGTEIVYVTKSHFAGVLQDDPRIDEFIKLEPSTSLASLIRHLKKQNVDAILDLHGKWRGLATRLSHPFTPSALLSKPSRLQQFLVRRGFVTFRPKHSIVERYYMAAERLFRMPLQRSLLSLHVSDTSKIALLNAIERPLEELE